jgi:hypothetical protein
VWGDLGVTKRSAAWGRRRPAPRNPASVLLIRARCRLPVCPAAWGAPLSASPRRGEARGSLPQGVQGRTEHMSADAVCGIGMRRFTLTPAPLPEGEGLGVRASRASLCPIARTRPAILSAPEGGRVREGAGRRPFPADAARSRNPVRFARWGSCKTFRHTRGTCGPLQSLWGKPRTPGFALVLAAMPPKPTQNPCGAAHRRHTRGRGEGFTKHIPPRPLW